MKWVGLLLAIVGLIFFVREVSLHVGIADLGAAITAYRETIFIALLGYIAAFIPMVAAWHIIQRACGGTFGAVQSARIFLISQFAKYLPGNVGHLIGRVVLAKAAGMPAKTATAALLLENVGVLIAASALIAIALAAGFVNFTNAPWLIAAGLGMAILGCAAALFLLSRDKNRPKLRIAPLGQAIVLFSILFGLIVSVQLILLLNVGYETPNFSLIALISSAVLVSWLAGFVTPGAPAGIGIREASLVALLYGVLPESQVLIAAAAMRIVTMLGDAIMWAIGLAIGREQRTLAAELTVNQP
ncbi:MAG: lysylphosphatidylglycerol synthase domain-containing protein [Erythrobacter sp.]